MFLKNFVNKIIERFVKIKKIVVQITPFEQLEKSRQTEIAFKCREYISDGIIRQILEIINSESEARELYQSSTEPFTTTEAKLERYYRKGLNDLLERLIIYSNTIEERPEAFDKFSVV